MDVSEAKHKLEFIASENPRKYAKRLLDLYNSCTAQGKLGKEARMEAVDLLWEGIEPKGEAGKRLQQEKEVCQSLCELAITTCDILFYPPSAKSLQGAPSAERTAKTIENFHAIYEFFKQEAPEHLCSRVVERAKEFPASLIVRIRS